MRKSGNFLVLYLWFSRNMSKWWWPLDTVSGFLCSKSLCQMAGGADLLLARVKPMGEENYPEAGAYFCGSSVSIKVSVRESDSWRVTGSPDTTCQPFLGNNVGVIWGGRRDACLLTCLGELLSKPRRGWMIKQGTRDSWLNWRLHLGTKNLNKSLGPRATYFPWRVCIFSQQNFVEGYVFEEWTGMGMWNLMAHCTRELKNCRRFKTNSCYNFLKDCEIIKMHMNQVLICCMVGG